MVRQLASTGFPIGGEPATGRIENSQNYAL
jgi:hypothetical protein